MWGSDNRKMGLHVSDQRQDPIPCLAPPVPQEHSKAKYMIRTPGGLIEEEDLKWLLS